MTRPATDTLTQIEQSRNATGPIAAAFIAAADRLIPNKEAKR